MTVNFKNLSYYQFLEKPTRHTVNLDENLGNKTCNIIFRFTLKSTIMHKIAIKLQVEYKNTIIRENAQTVAVVVADAAGFSCFWNVTTRTLIIFEISIRIK